MIGAGLLARNAVARGLRSKPWVKTSLAPGSPGGHRVSGPARACRTTSTPSASIWWAIGCTTCIGNSGPLPEPISAGVNDNDMVAACSVLSGNRNFEGRVNPDVRPTTWPRRRWWSPTRWPASMQTRTGHQRAAGRGLRRPAGLSRRHLAELHGRSPSLIEAGSTVDAGDVRHRATPTCSRATITGTADRASATGRDLRLGRIGLHLRAATHPISRA